MKRFPVETTVATVARRGLPILVTMLFLAACSDTADLSDFGPANDLGVQTPDATDPGPADVPKADETGETDPGQQTDPGEQTDTGTADQGEDIPAIDDARTDFGPPQCEGELLPQPLPDEADSTFLRGPYVQNVTTTGAVIVWRPAIITEQEGCVSYTVDDVPKTACVMPDARGQYEVSLSDLPPATQIPYSVAVGDTETTVPLAFFTAPDTPRPVRLLVFADGHRNQSVLRPIALAGLADGTDVAVSVGDLISQPEEDQFDEALDGLRPLMHRVPMYAVLGNHEARGANHFAAFVVPGAALDAPKERYYSVRHGNVWMGMLEVIDFQVSQMFNDETAQVVWLRNALDSEEARTARWRLLFIHHPLWSLGWGHCGGYHGEDSLREILLPLAVEGGVAAIFSGHMHGYERGEVDGVTLVINGGGGGSLDMECPEPEDFPSPWVRDYTFHRVIVDAGCDTLSIEARDLEERLIDHVDIPYIDPAG